MINRNDIIKCWRQNQNEACEIKVNSSKVLKAAYTAQSPWLFSFSIAVGDFEKAIGIVIDALNEDSAPQVTFVITQDQLSICFYAQEAGIQKNFITVLEQRLASQKIEPAGDAVGMRAKIPSSIYTYFAPANVTRITIRPDDQWPEGNPQNHFKAVSSQIYLIKESYYRAHENDGLLFGAPPFQLALEKQEKEVIEVDNESTAEYVADKIDSRLEQALSDFQHKVNELSNYIALLSDTINQSKIQSCIASLNTLVLETKSASYSDEILRNFEQNCKNNLTEIDAEIKHHRAAWKPILANVLLALTGVGALLIAGKAFYASCISQEGISINSTLFGGRTVREQKVAAIAAAAKSINPKRGLT